MVGKAGSYIITKGLGVNHKACEGLITTHFSLYCIKIEINVGGGGGGYYPGDAWNKVSDATSFFAQPDNLYNPDKKYFDKSSVKITVELGKIKSEKVFLVPINKINILVKVIDVVNTTKDRILVNVSKIKKVIHNISVSVTDILKK